MHLYAEPTLLAKARDEIASCDDLTDYSKLAELPFLNSCIDEAVRLHTMLPGNTVLRKTKRDVQLGSHTVPAGAVLWLYPNAVHLDDGVFPEPKAFCPMRLLRGKCLDSLILEQGRLDWRLATRLALHVARGLAHLEARGVIHRDVKPENVMVCAGEGGGEGADSGVHCGDSGGVAARCGEGCGGGGGE